MSSYLEHVQYVVRAIDRAIAFYTSVFDWNVRGRGFEQAADRSYHWVHIGTDETYLAFRTAYEGGEAVPDPALTHSHLGIVVDNLDRVAARLTECNMPYRRKAPHPYRERIYVRDPDGYEIEIVHYLSTAPAERNDYLIDGTTAPFSDDPGSQERRKDAEQLDLAALLEKLMADAEIWRPRMLMSAVRLGVFAQLGDRALSASQIANSLATDREATSRLLAALHECGYVERVGDTYKNGEAARHFLVPTSPHYVGSWFELHDRDWQAWGELSELIRTGGSPSQGSFTDDPRRLSTLLHAAHQRALLFHLAATVQALDLAWASSLLDLGGGAGSYSLAFCEAYPELHCTLFDLPEAIEVARSTTEAYPFADRIAFRAGNYRSDDLGGPYDVAFLSNILHGENSAAAQALLHKVGNVVADDGCIVVRDNFLDDDGTNASGGALFGLALMIETEDGRTHRLSDVCGMLRHAGFGRVDRLDTHLIAAWRDKDSFQPEASA